MKKIVVAHPGTQHSQRLAVALKKGNLLFKYATSFYWDESKFPCNLINILPGKYKEKVRDLTFKRHSLALNGKDVITFMKFYEILLILGGRLHVNKKYLDKMMLWKNGPFSQQIGKYCKENQVHCLVSYDTSSYEAFKWLKDSNVLKIIDLSHPAWNYCENIIQEEEKLQPDFAATIDHNVRDKQQLSRVVEEIKMADYIIVASTNSKKSLLYNGYDKNKIFIVPYGVESDKFKPNFNKFNSKIKFLFVGSIGQRKGIKYLLEAFKQLNRNDIELHLVGKMVGDAGIYEPYQKYFTYHGRVTNGELPKYFADSDVFIFPSLIEGFGLVILEAMAAGLPVICSENTGGYDIIDEGNDGFVVPIRNVEKIKQSIEKFANDKTLIRKMGINARNKAVHYSWERYEDNLNEIFNEILQVTDNKGKDEEYEDPSKVQCN